MGSANATSVLSHPSYHKEIGFYRLKSLSGRRIVPKRRQRHQLGQTTPDVLFGVVGVGLCRVGDDDDGRLLVDVVSVLDVALELAQPLAAL